MMIKSKEKERDLIKIKISRYLAISGGISGQLLVGHSLASWLSFTIFNNVIF